MYGIVHILKEIIVPVQRIKLLVLGKSHLDEKLLHVLLYEGGIDQDVVSIEFIQGILHMGHFLGHILDFVLGLQGIILVGH